MTINVQSSLVGCARHIDPWAMVLPWSMLPVLDNMFRLTTPGTKKTVQHLPEWFPGAGFELAILSPKTPEADARVARSASAFFFDSVRKQGDCTTFEFDSGFGRCSRRTRIEGVVVKFVAGASRAGEYYISVDLQRLLSPFSW